MIDVNSIILPREVLDDTVEVLRDYGEVFCEGFVLWVGEIEGQEATVHHAFVPPQNSIQGEDGVGYFVTSETLFALNKFLSKTGLRLIAQVHSHPTRAYHSPTDDRYAIVAFEGGLSIVVPNFAEGPADILKWAVYRLWSGCWHLQNQKRVSTLFKTDEATGSSKRWDLLA